MRLPTSNRARTIGAGVAKRAEATANKIDLAGRQSSGGGEDPFARQGLTMTALVAGDHGADDPC